ncbi:hypothetical protein D3C71_946780 [compost metagenome]
MVVATMSWSFGVSAKTLSGIAPISKAPSAAVARKCFIFPPNTAGSYGLSTF